MSGINRRHARANYSTWPPYLDDEGGDADAGAEDEDGEQDAVEDGELAEGVEEAEDEVRVAQAAAPPEAPGGRGGGLDEAEEEISREKAHRRKVWTVFQQIFID